MSRTSSEKVTKKEAVRRALASLGPQARPAALSAWVKDELGLEVKPDHAGNVKSELLKAARAGAKEAAPPAGEVVVSLEDVRLLGELVDRVGGEQLAALVGLLAKRGK